MIIWSVYKNKARTIGFSEEKARMNMLLSRARHGLHVVADAYIYHNSEHWKPVIRKFISTPSPSGQSLTPVAYEPQKALPIRRVTNRYGSGSPLSCTHNNTFQLGDAEGGEVEGGETEKETEEKGKVEEGKAE